MRTLAHSIGICITALTLTSSSTAEPKTVIWTGWFSDSQCALARAASGTFTATNPDCAKRCIQNGSAPAFISEQAHAVFRILCILGIQASLGFQPMDRLLRFSSLVRKGLRFRRAFENAKRNVGPQKFDWYPYDTFANLFYMQHLL